MLRVQYEQQQRLMGRLRAKTCPTCPNISKDAEDILKIWFEKRGHKLPTTFEMRILAEVANVTTSQVMKWCFCARSGCARNKTEILRRNTNTNNIFMLASGLLNPQTLDDDDDTRRDAKVLENKHIITSVTGTLAQLVLPKMKTSEDGKNADDSKTPEMRSLDMFKTKTIQLTRYSPLPSAASKHDSKKIVKKSSKGICTSRKRNSIPPSRRFLFFYSLRERLRIAKATFDRDSYEALRKTYKKLFCDGGCDLAKMDKMMRQMKI